MDWMTLVANSDADMFILAVPPGVAGAIYYFTYRYYRNQDKRYKYEHETEVVMENKQSFNQKVDERTGLKSKHINGRNSHEPTARVRRVPVSPPTQR